MLTVAMVRSAAPEARAYKKADGKGLFLFVTPAGTKSWRMAYRFAGKAGLLTFGTFPEVTLSEARDHCDEARRLIRQNVDPAAAKRRARQGDAGGVTFEKIAREWHATQRKGWSRAHAADVIDSLERDVFPAIGAIAAEAVTTVQIRQLLRLVEERGAVETAHRLYQRISIIYDIAMSEGLVTKNPAKIVQRALASAGPGGRQPAAAELADARAIMSAIDASRATRLTKLASRLLALTAVRSAVVREARWSEIEGIDWTTGAVATTGALWRVPAARMKLVAARKADQAFEHLVPLSTQAVAVLREARRISGLSPFVFPGRSGRALSENALATLYRRAGLEGRHVPHGWRAAFSTIMNERNATNRAVIDLALAHLPKDKVEGAYNRAQHLDLRAALLQEWADLLLGPGAAA